MKKRDQKGEGWFGLFLLLAVIGGLGYAAYYYFLSDNSKGKTAAQTQAASGGATPTDSNNGQNPKPGSMAGAAAQGASAAGEVYGSGR